MTAPIRVDEELGPVRYCRGCDEWWPMDEEFWYREMSERRNAWHCRACKADHRLRVRAQPCSRCLIVLTRHDECHGCAGRIAGPLTVAKLVEWGLAPVVE